MKTLQEAWDWYQSAKTNLERMRRLARHWDDESLQNASIWQDEKFKRLEATEIEAETAIAIQPLNDLGVLVLFSVFEAAVRDHFESVIKPLTARLGHPILQEAAEEVLEDIRQGSFANKVLTPLKNQRRISPELGDKVKQVRDYRNWIAHGKREHRAQDIINLTVVEAFARLKEFLDTLGIAVETELTEIVESGEHPIGDVSE